MSPFLVMRFSRPLAVDEVTQVLRALGISVPDWVASLDQPVAICAVRCGAAPDEAAVQAARALGASQVAFVGVPDGRPQELDVEALPFPIDGHASAADDDDETELGLAIKLAGPARPGVEHVLAAFRALWLSAYERPEEGGVTYDRKRNAAHFWLETSEQTAGTSGSREERVHHLVWIAARLHEVVPVLYARFAATAASQKLGGVLGPPSEAFVLGGNPLLAAYAADGDLGVRRWIDQQTDWSREEVAVMLRELAIELASAQPEDVADEDAGDDELDEAAGDDRPEHQDITGYAGDVLRERAAAGLLHERAADRLIPVLATPERYEQRRIAVVEILGAARHRPALPALLGVLETTTIRSALDAIGKDELLAATATALGAIGDPQAIGPLARLVAMPGGHYDRARPPAAEALAACLGRSPGPNQPIDDALRELLTTISERNDGELNADAHLAYGLLALCLPPDRRAEAHRRLADADTARDDAVAKLARHAALVLSSPTTPVEPPPGELQLLVHESLTSLDYDHEYTIRNVRIALRVALLVPAVVDPEDLVWLTRLAEPDVRREAHALLAKLGRPLDEAPRFDIASVRSLDDRELVRLVGEPHIIGRAALIGEIGRRNLVDARPAVIAACNDVVSRARPGGANLIEPDMHVLDASIPFLRDLPLDDDTSSLFERILRHPNVNVRVWLAPAGMDSN